MSIFPSDFSSLRLKEQGVGERMYRQTTVHIAWQLFDDSYHQETQETIEERFYLGPEMWLTG